MIQDGAADSEAIFRGLVALGTAVSIEEDEVKTAAKQVFGIMEALKNVPAKETRIQEVKAEIGRLLS